jgi:hypothetical protein
MKAMMFLAMVFMSPGQEAWVVEIDPKKAEVLLVNEANAERKAIVDGLESLGDARDREDWMIKNLYGRQFLVVDVGGGKVRLIGNGRGDMTDVAKRDLAKCGGHSECNGDRSDNAKGLRAGAAGGR